MAKKLYQLAPTPSFVEPQRRELNSIFLRLGNDIETGGGGVLFGDLAARPSPGVRGRFFVATDQLMGNRLSVDTGTAWFQLI